MKHLAFYYAIGFAIVGCLMLYAGLSTFVTMVSNSADRFDTAVLATAMLLPFVISTLSWRDWREIIGKKDPPQESLKTQVTTVQSSSGNSRSVLWVGKPWILPSVVTKSVLIVAVAVLTSWLELSFGVAFYAPVLNIPIALWTSLVVFLVWLIGSTRLLLLRASNTYILRSDSLEIRVGILTSKSFVIAPSGFSDLEVIRSVSARIVNSGDIIVRTQSETESNIEMERVRNPLRVADRIREVMARPIVRMAGKS
jgi:hypothetical protein